MGRFKVEDIFAGDAASSDLQEFTCAVCMSFFDDPVQLACTHIFCESCVAPCEACPTCRERLDGVPARGRQPLHECNKPMYCVMSRIKVRCPYHEGGARGDVARVGAARASDSKAAPSSSGSKDSEGTSLEAAEWPKMKRCRRDAYGDGAVSADAEAEECASCPWTGEYGDLLAHHLRICELHAVECPKGCGETVQRRRLEAHLESCVMNLQKCYICGERMKSQRMAEHSREAAELHVRILEDKLRQQESGRATLATVIERIDKLEKLQEKAASKAEQAAQRAAQEAAQQDLQRGCKMTWQVPIREWLAKGCPQRAMCTSSQATLRDGIKTNFDFYPGGKGPDAVDEAGNKFASLFVHGPLRGDAEVEVLTGDGRQLFKRTLIDKGFATGWGCMKLCRVATIQLEERLVIRANFQKVREHVVVTSQGP